MELIDAKRKLEKRYARQNEYNKNKYDRFSLMLPTGYKEVIKEQAKKEGKSLNNFILEAIQEKMKKLSKL